MSTTLLTMRDYIKSFYGLDTKIFTGTLLNFWINDANRNVPIDLIRAGIGLENFIKTTSLTYITVPINSAQVTSSVATIDTTGVHGLSVGDYVIIQDLGVPFTALNGEWLVATVPDTDTFTFAINSANIAGAGQSVGWAGKGFASAPTDLFTMPNSLIHIEAKFKTTAGVAANDTYFKPLDEKTISYGRRSDSVKTNANGFDTPSSTQPYYWIEGNASIAKVIHIRPANVDICRITYYAMAVTLSADGDNISVGDEHRDLIRLWVKQKIEEKKGNASGKAEAITEYQNELKRIVNEYKQSKENQNIEQLETEIK